LGLKDGAVIAFAFIEESGGRDGLEFKVEWSSYEAEYGDDDDMAETAVEPDAGKDDD
jgi:hypothetical protein